MERNFTQLSSRWLFAAMLLAIAALFAWQASPGFAATERMWNGSADGKWSTPENWTPEGAPEDGDSLVFPVGAPANSNNDITGLDLAEVTISADGYSFTGNSFSVSSSIEVIGVASIANSIVLSGDVTLMLTGETTSLVLNGILDLHGHELTIDGDGDVRVSQLTGTGAIVKDGEGTAEYAGLNSYSGPTTINGGTLLVAGPGVSPCAAGPLSRLPANGIVTLGLSGTLELECSVTIGGLSGAGNVVLTGEGVALTVATAAPPDPFSGNISGPGSLIVTNGASTGIAPLVLAGANTYTGATIVDGGALALVANASIGASSGVSVTNDGIFGGQGTSAAISAADGVIYPSEGGAFGTLTTTALTLTGETEARFLVGLNDADQIVVNGPVALGDAELHLILASGFDPVVGSEFRIIAGATSLTGAFAGLPEGAIFGIGGKLFSITYNGAGAGSSGHDVIITREPALPADLAVTKTASSASAQPGGSVTYTITVKNLGPNAAPFPQLSDTLPPQLLFESLSAPAGWTCAKPAVGSAGSITCNANTIANGATVSFTLVTTVASTASGDITNTAAIASSANESASANNSASATVRVSTSARPYRLILPMLARDGVVE